jgi:hypothetical protein
VLDLQPLWALPTFTHLNSSKAARPVPETTSFMPILRPAMPRQALRPGQWARKLRKRVDVRTCKRPCMRIASTDASIPCIAPQPHAGRLAQADRLGLWHSERGERA